MKAEGGRVEDEGGRMKAEAPEGPSTFSLQPSSFRKVLVLSSLYDEAEWTSEILGREAAGAEVTLVIPDEALDSHQSLYDESVRIVTYSYWGLTRGDAAQARGPFDECFIFWERPGIRNRRLRLLALTSGAQRFRIFDFPGRTERSFGRAGLLLDTLLVELIGCAFWPLRLLHQSFLERLVLRALVSRGRRRPPGPAHPERVHFLVGSLGLGGAQRQLVSLVRGLGRRGFQCKVWLLYAGDPYFAGQVEAAGCTWENVWNSCGAKGGPSSRWMRNVYLLWRLINGRSDIIPAAVFAAHLRRERPGVLQTMLDRTNVAGMLAGRMACVPVVVGGLVSLHPRDRSDLARYRRNCYAAIDGDHFDALIAVSRAGAESYFKWERRFPAGKMRVVHYGIDEDWAPAPRAEDVRALSRELGIAPEVPVIAYLGRLSPEKNLGLLLEACAELARKGTDFRALIVGYGPERDRLRCLADELGLDGKVLFTGARRDVPAIMSRARLVALSSDAEGFPNALLEAQFLGRPVVSTRAGGAGEVVADGVTGFLVDVGDHEAMADRMRRLILDEALAERMGRAAAAHARERFSTERMVEATLSIYRELAEAKGLRLGNGIQQGCTG